MSSAQLMQEELQHSVVVSDPEPDMDVDDEANADVLATRSEGDIEDDEMDGDVDADGEEDVSDRVEDEDEDEDSASEEEDEADDDDAFDEDAEGEDEDDIHSAEMVGVNNIPSVEDEEEDAEEDNEGVGAVKLRPGETDAEESSESEASEAAAASDAESDGEAAWEEAVEAADDDDDESDNPNQETCMFCREDEEHDPSDEFEEYLTCTGCGENAHQQCAREHNSLSVDTDPEAWKCPDCYGEESDAAAAEDADGRELDGGSLTGSPPATRRATAPKLARDLLPSQRGAIKPDSHSVFNQLVLDEDPMDGSRVLRKRKTSSAEADETIMNLRKRRRTTVDDLDLENGIAVEEPIRPESARSLRPKTSVPLVSVEKKRGSCILNMRVESRALDSILSKKPKGPKKNSEKPEKARSRPGTARSAVHVGSSAGAPYNATAFSQPFYSFFDRDTDELKGKPYGGILTEAEADTSKTLPTNDDRRRFDEAKQKAEEEWRQRVLAMQAEMEAPLKKSKKSSGPASQIECIEFGGCEIDTWYAAPYPEEYSRNRVLYICEFCLKYMNSAYVAWRHKLKCPAKHPPGDEIYRNKSISIFEVDGRKNPVYCQNLCLLAKLFLGSKTLYYDVEPFLFYVLCEYDDLGYHFVGYFSKEKRASSQNNVSCILTLPNHQRKGYGNLLIDFSYLLTKVEQKTGSPEKPLSDMGLVSYRNYWRLVLCRYLLEQAPGNRAEQRGLSIKKISDDTGMTADDVVAALEGLRCLVRDPQTELYAFRVDFAFCREYVAKWESKKYVTLNAASLTWTPYVMGRSNATNFELGPALTAIAPREDDEDVKVAEVTAAILANGNGPAAVALVNGLAAKPETESQEGVIETTEATEGESKPEEATTEATDAMENGTAAPGSPAQPEAPTEAAVDGESRGHADIDDWAEAYKDVPVSRFTVFPPLSARRLDRPRPSVARPLVARTGSAPQIQRSASSARKSSSNRPKPSGSRKKTGGTGRGPGRWPKGTRKSDYGNADSGPGFPPGWVADRARLSTSVTPKRDAKGQEREASEGLEEEEPTVKVQTMSAKDKRPNGINGMNSAKGKVSPRSAKSKRAEEEDLDMADVDADGEDE